MAFRKFVKTYRSYIIIIKINKITFEFLFSLNGFKFLFFKKASNYSNANDNENENEEEPKSGKEKRFYSKKINLQP